MDPHDLKERWLDDAAAHAGIDRRTWDPTLGVGENTKTIEAVYTYYGSLFLSKPRFEWPGLAALVGASFYAAFRDIDAMPKRMLRAYEDTFLLMQKKIFEDQAVMHEAYQAEGVPGIKELYSAQIIDWGTVLAWQAIDGGNREEWHDGNHWLVYREQDDIIDYFYYSMLHRHGLEGKALTYLFTLLGMPSVPGAHPYSAVFPLLLAGGPCRLATPLADGNIASFPNRWGLIERDTLPAYLRLIEDNATQAEEEIKTAVAERATAFLLRNRVRPLASGFVTSWSFRTGSPWKLGISRADANGRPSRTRPLRLDLSHESAWRTWKASVRGWANPRHRPFPVEIALPDGKHFSGKAQLVKMYRPTGLGSPMRLTVKLPPVDVRTAERTLQLLADDWFIDRDSIGAWLAGSGRPAELGHAYSTRVFRGERVRFVEIEVQVEQHVTEQQIVIDVLFSHHLES